MKSIHWTFMFHMVSVRASPFWRFSLAVWRVFFFSFRCLSFKSQSLVCTAPFSCVYLAFLSLSKGRRISESNPTPRNRVTESNNLANCITFIQHISWMKTIIRSGPQYWKERKNWITKQKKNLIKGSQVYYVERGRINDHDTTA